MIKKPPKSMFVLRTIIYEIPDLRGRETDGETAWGNSHPLVEKQMSKIVNFYTPLFVEIAKYCDYAHSV
jgi:hypothetical protein